MLGGIGRVLLLLADGDELHLGRDHPLSRVAELCHVPARLRSQRSAPRREGHAIEIVQVASRRLRAGGQLLDVAASADPSVPECGKTFA
jgi:hypothetical protein